MTRTALAFVALLALLAGARTSLAADAPWETEVRKAIKEQEGLLEEAQRTKTTGNIVSRYQSRFDRTPTPLALFLVGRAQFHHGDVAGAEASLQRVLAMEPRFWFARHGLTLIALKRDDVPAARRHVDEALRQKPDDVQLLRAAAQARVRAEDWDAALGALRRLIELEPGDLTYRKARVDCLTQKKDWAGALAELQTLESSQPEDAWVRWNVAMALVQLGRLDDAARRLEVLARTRSDEPRVWLMLRNVYARRLEERVARGEISGAAFEADRANFIRAVERSIPLVNDAEYRKHAQAAIEAVRKPLVAAAPAPVEESAEQEWTRIVEWCLDEASVERRRKGLQAFHGMLRGESAHPGAAVPVPTAFFTRVHESIEPDATCRAWLMRILGSAGAQSHPFLAMYAAFALYDPESDVRRTAAEALGAIGTPAGIVYLRAFLDLIPTGAEATESDLRELNAARMSLAMLTKHDDVPGAREAWIPVEDAPGTQRHWREFFRTPDGAAGVVAGIRDLAAIGEMFPQRHLVELVNEPDFDVAKAAYLGLLERSKGPPRGGSETTLEREFWPKFPRLAVEDITPASIQSARDVVNAWWAGFRQAREKAPVAVGSPDVKEDAKPK